jgi:hypothetical protein
MEPWAPAEAVMVYGLPVLAVKTALTLRLALMVTVQVLAVPLQAPPQPPKVELASGVAVKVTVVPLAKDVPAGVLLTDPLPVPLFDTVRA